jgi:DNA-binding NarL/FixJ family response regulator
MATVSIAVAIIEDDAPAREILARWIRRADGFRCVGEHDCAESALRGLPQEKPDVVLVDINLPGLNGIECVRRLKPLLPQTQFVMLTVYEDADHIFDALKAGATGYLLKQTPRQELLTALRQVHAGGSPMTSNIARKVVQSFQQQPWTRVAEGQEWGETAELSPREREVLDLLAKGYLYKEIADTLSISLPTVNTYIRRIYEKLHVRSRGQAVARYVQWPPPVGRTDGSSRSSGPGKKG